MKRTLTAAAATLVALAALLGIPQALPASVNDVRPAPAAGSVTRW